MKRTRKIPTCKFVPIFRKAAALRKEMVDAGFTDNAGAIHSCERILDILGLRLNYPELSHISKLSQHQDAEFSEAALAAHKRGEKIFIEHVSPLRDMTRKAICRLYKGASDKEFKKFIRKHYLLVLLTKEERQHLDRINRSRMTPDPLDRLREAGIIAVVKNRDD